MRAVKISNDRIRIERTKGNLVCIRLLAYSGKVIHRSLSVKQARRAAAALLQAAEEMEKEK